MHFAVSVLLFTKDVDISTFELYNILDKTDLAVNKYIMRYKNGYL